MRVVVVQEIDGESVNEVVTYEDLPEHTTYSALRARLSTEPDMPVEYVFLVETYMRSVRMYTPIGTVQEGVQTPAAVVTLRFVKVGGAVNASETGSSRRFLHLRPDPDLLARSLLVVRDRKDGDERVTLAAGYENALSKSVTCCGSVLLPRYPACTYRDLRRQVARQLDPDLFPSRWDFISVTWGVNDSVPAPSVRVLDEDCRLPDDEQVCVRACGPAAAMNAPRFKDPCSWLTRGLLRRSTSARVVSS